MSQTFTTITTFPFKGTTSRYPVAQPAGWQSPSGQIVPPSFCPITIDWNVYWQLAGQPSSVGVQVNLQAASYQAFVLDRITSVKIDNTGSQSPVYVYFPDSGDTVTCPPNSTATFPCLTNGLLAFVYAEGLEAGFIPQTKVFFYNIYLPPSIDAEINQALALSKASPVISRGTTIYNQNYGTPALGDQLFSTSTPLYAPIVPVNMWNTPYASGFLYITDLEVYCASLEMNGFGYMSIYSTGPAGLLTKIFFGTATNVTFSGPLYSIKGNIKLDATQTWELTVNAPGLNGEAGIYSSYTVSDL